jgi:hypothetical protein
VTLTVPLIYIFMETVNLGQLIKEMSIGRTSDKIWDLHGFETGLTGCGNSPAASDEWHVVAVMEAEFALEGAIVH